MMTGMATVTATVTDRSGVRRRVGLLATTHMVDDFYQGAVPVLLALFAVQRGYTGLAAGGIMFAATFVSSLLQPAFGLLTDRHRMPWLIPGGMLLAGVGISLSGLVDNYAYTWLVVAAAGCGVAAFHPEASRATREAAGASTQAMSWFSVGGNVGLAVAPVVVTPLLAYSGLHGTPLLVVPAVLLAGWLAWRGGWRRRSAAGKAGRPAARGTAAGTPARDDRRRFGWLLVVVVMRSISYVGIATFLVLYLHHHFGMSTTAAAPALTVFTGVGAAGTLLGGWLADRYGRTRILRIGYALALVGICCLVLAPTVALAYGAVVLAGLGLYLPFAIHTTLGQDYLPHRLATASGLTTGLSVSAGGALAPVLGVLVDHAGEHVMLAVLAAAPIIALLASTALSDNVRPVGVAGAR